MKLWGTLILVMVWMKPLASPKIGPPTEEEFFKTQEYIFYIPIEKRIDFVLQKAGIQPFNRRLIIAQAKLESGNFKNKLTRKHNNIFAMRHPSRRPTTSLGPLATAEKRKGYASYASIEDATRDFLMYLEYVKLQPKYKSTYAYVSDLKRKRYFESNLDHYVKGIKYYLN